MRSDDDAPSLVDQDDAERLLQTLVEIPSPSRDEHDAVEALVSWLADRGWHAHRDEAGNAVGVLGSGANEILLLGHIDTFPGTVPVRREGDRLYGRGSVDAKGPLCMFACAATGLAVPDGWRITLVGAVEEESTTSRGARHVLAGRPMERAPRYCVIGEPSRWDRITLGYKGSLHAYLDLRYPYSHSAGPGTLPAEAAVDLWREVQRFCAERNTGRSEREFDRLTPALHSLVTAEDGGFGTASLHLGFRLSTTDDLDALQAELANTWSETVRSAPAGTTLDHHFRGAEPAHRSPKSTPLVRAFLRSVREEKGTPRFVLKTGTADFNVVAPGWPATPIVAYGPGDSALDHTPDEHIELAEFHQAIAVLRRTLAALSGGP